MYKIFACLKSLARTLRSRMLGLSSCILTMQMRKLRHWMVILYLLPLTSKWHLNPYPNSSSSQRERPGPPPLGLIP